MSRRLIEGEILPLSDLEAMVTPQEWSTSAQRFGSISRRCEWLSWRAHLRRSLSISSFCGISADVQLCYTSGGAPQILGSKDPVYIAVTHTRSRVAILLAERPCGVDMEILSRNFGRVSSRYLSPSESDLATNVIPEQLFMAIAWCVKEAAYKYAATPALDFLRDIVIESLNPTTQQVVVRIEASRHTCQYTICGEDHILVTLED